MAVILTAVAVTAELFSRLGLFSPSEARHSDTPALTDDLKTKEEETPKEEETEQSREEGEEEEEESAEKNHFLNTTEHIVDDALRGLVRACPHLILLSGHRVVLRSDVEEYKAGHVAVISGGGSGHEPSHAGFVGKGMLTAAVAGDVFASPPASTVYAAIRAAAGPKGALLIVKNYTGDRLNFGLAAERARAEGIPVEVVIVGEDCALPRGASKAGRRGLAGTLFVHKVSGALAELGHSLEEILPAAQAVAADIATMSVSLAPCLVPGRGPCFILPSGTMGIGLGIHGEEGVSREPLAASRVVARRLVQGLLNSDDGFGYFQAERGQRVALMLNNLGGTSMLELQVMMADILEELVDVRGLQVERVYFGSMMTSLAMAGVSVTLMHLEDKIANMPREIWLDIPVGVVGWSVSIAAGGQFKRCDLPPLCDQDGPSKSPVQNETGVQRQHDARRQQWCLAIERSCSALIKEERKIAHLDALSGDGDCGETMRRAAEAILAALNGGQLGLSSPAQLTQTLANALDGKVGGTSGALYGILFTSASNCARQIGDSADMPASDWGKMLMAGLQAVMKYGGASEDDRTMLDVLLPVARLLQQEANGSRSLPASVVDVAQQAAKRTASLQAHAGRASYSQPTEAHMDAGAYAAATWISGVAPVFETAPSSFV